MAKSTARTVINLSMNDQGYSQFNITVQGDSPASSARDLGEAVELVRGLIAEKKIKFLHKR